MIDRYTLTSSPGQLKTTFPFLTEMPVFDAQYNASPAKHLPVATLQAPTKIQNFRWGFISGLSNNKKMSHRLFNADIVQGLSKLSIKKSLSRDRCIIFATGFYVWKLLSKKMLTPHYAHFESGQPFAIAGFWEEKDEFVEHSTDSFMMLTRPANSHISEYQQDMPFILPHDKISNWLDPGFDVQECISWMENAPSDTLSIYPVSPAINHVDLNDERLIKRSLPADQHGNYTLFG